MGFEKLRKPYENIVCWHTDPALLKDALKFVKNTNNENIFKFCQLSFKGRLQFQFSFILESQRNFFDLDANVSAAPELTNGVEHDPTSEARTNDDRGLDVDNQLEADDGPVTGHARDLQKNRSFVAEFCDIPTGGI